MRAKSAIAFPSLPLLVANRVTDKVFFLYAAKIYLRYHMTPCLFLRILR